jgi:membrane-associated protein
MNSDGKMFQLALDWVFHLDGKLAAVSAAHGSWVYVILFVVIFLETGLVVLPFLPGDSLLFVAGTLAAGGTLRLAWLLLAVAVAAIGGDTINFVVGSLLRKHVSRGSTKRRFLNQAHLARTQAFFDKHGPQAIILARFVPVVRTFAPFVAALGHMPYGRFLTYNVVGGLFWVGVLIGAGYGLGNVGWVHDHLSTVLLGVVVLSILPGVIGWARQRASGAPGKQSSNDKAS